MPKERPCVLSIAGFDSSGGAGVLADTKTFEANKVLGLGVVTGLTFQNDSEFDGVKWIETDEIIKQIDVLFRKHKVEFVKIGMIKDLDTLSSIVSHLTSDTCLRADPPPADGTQGYRGHSSHLKIIWDPIIKTSSGFEFHKNLSKEKIISICKKVFLLTPNIEEIKILTGENDEMLAAKKLSEYCNVFLKGGHSKEKKGRDYLFTVEGKLYPFRAKKIAEGRKHGSGCVLSSAITANLANGNNLQRACLKGKNYVTIFLMSNKTLLGFHKT